MVGFIANRANANPICFDYYSNVYCSSCRDFIKMPEILIPYMKQNVPSPVASMYYIICL